MTLLAAAQSLGIIELAGVSWINVRSLGACHEAVFTMALLLPFRDPRLPPEFCTGKIRFWPDQIRVLESPTPMEAQILELHTSQVLGNLSVVKLTASRIETPSRWIIQTHTRDHEERTAWLKSVIAIEGRAPTK